MDILPDIPNSNRSRTYYVIIIIIIIIILYFHHHLTINSTTKNKITHTIQPNLPQPPSRYGQPFINNNTLSTITTTTKNSSYSYHSNFTSLITAILIVNSQRDWKSHGQIPYQQTLQQFIQYPYISEIIIWNNDLKTHISTSDYDHHQSIKLRIFNLPGDMGSDDQLSISHHLACSLATHSNCYFQVR
ncbi:hypothetical protein CROQUDRAFT_498673 [Cronartium quercuum f. sp. fusiforme G11]|uniref:Uncharacterized protein n=1 Tax=Cronartium quercuum f. sp. fusiforme G11 TaxID=708437 RepID=A0A9P6TCP4_9BASI|nr:hypothetical protein CROQUDRAFT_498673 [Cronartium quercuum f. sp. fusiforme G11]